MAREIPEVVRAVAGLAATVLDEARKLPETLPGLPVRLIGQALQASLKLQQQYSGLVARGDEVFTGLRGEGEPGMATFDDDLPAPPPPAGGPAPRSSAFDRVDDSHLDAEPVVEQLADELADDLAVADLPLAGPDTLAGAEPADLEALPDEAAAVLAISVDDDSADLSPAEVSELPDDPAADAVTAVVDALAAEVDAEIGADAPADVPEQVLDELSADTVAEILDEEAAVEEALAEEVLEEAVEEAVAEELIADAAVGGTPPAPDAHAVHSLDDLRSEPAPEQTELVDDADPDVAALAEAAEEMVDLGGPEAAESVTPGSGIGDSAASDPLVAADQPTDDQPTDEQPTDEPAGGSDLAGSQAAGTSPVEGYDSFSIPALRGRLRGYPTETVADLLDYERATRARAPYVTLLQNRLEKLSADRG